jgi:hypothetical protein
MYNIGKQLADWEFTPIYAQAYLGAWGIVEALKGGADIVLCGRVTDASPTIGCAAYYHNWTRESYDQLAHAFVAGHFIECSTYVTGGNFSGFKSLLGASTDLAFPIVEISPQGEFIVTMQNGRDGMVTVDTCKAQLLYEIQGPLYYNPDVVAVLDSIVIKEEGHNRVYVESLFPEFTISTNCLVTSRMSRASSPLPLQRLGSPQLEDSKQKFITSCAASTLKKRQHCWKSKYATC